MAQTLRPRVIVTRPAREARRWVDALHAHGIDAVALPLIEIAPLAPGMPTGPLAADSCAALMFVSVPAVEGFFEINRAPALMEQAQSAIDLIANARCWAPGSGTAQALLRAGVPAARIDQPAPGAAQLDSEALWAQVQPQVRPGTRVLLVRGANAGGQPQGRDWLARAIAAAGGVADTAVVYRRLPPVFDAAAQQLARAAASNPSDRWLFSSSEAVRHLQAVLSDVDWRAARALATHPRIAQAARGAGFGSVTEVPPRLDALVATLESIR